MLTLTKNKKLFGLIMLIFTILAFYYTTYAVVSPKTNFYVNDYADVLSEETENYILNSNIDLQSKTKAQIVVVTVKTLDGKTIEEYATELFREFGIGDKEKNNGVLLLCSTGDRMFRIEVGYGLEGALPDGKTGRIQDQYIIPYLKNDNYDEGIKNGFSAILGVFAIVLLESGVWKAVSFAMVVSAIIAVGYKDIARKADLNKAKMKRMEERNKKDSN